MKITTIIGTRPELIRLSRIIPKLDNACEHVFIHTGQNYDRQLKDVFFEELNIRQPDIYFGIEPDLFAHQVGEIFTKTEKALKEVKPDRALILGDTNSALSAFIAKRLGIPVYHMEAGNRCYDDRVPEEINRRVIDHCSEILMPYTERSRDNLLREGIDGRRIFVVGNPIKEVLDGIPKIDKTETILITAHRQENVDDMARLHKILIAAGNAGKAFNKSVIFPIHPRTSQHIKFFSRAVLNGIDFCKPLGLSDFVNLERNAFCVLTDSGTVQEECCIMGVPCVTIRDTTERPETVECGSNILSGVESDNVLRCIKLAVERRGKWTPPPEYMRDNVSDTVLNIMLGYR